MNNLKKGIELLKVNLRLKKGFLIGLIVIQGIMGIVLGICIRELIFVDGSFNIFNCTVTSTIFISFIAISLIIGYSTTNSESIEFLEAITSSIDSSRNRLLNNMLIKCKEELREQICITYGKEQLSIDDLKSCLQVITTHFKYACSEVINSNFSIGIYLKGVCVPTDQNNMNDLKIKTKEEIFFLFDDLKLEGQIQENLLSEINLNGFPLFLKQGIERCMHDDSYFCIKTEKITQNIERKHLVIFSEIPSLYSNYYPNYSGVLFTVKSPDFKPYPELEEIYEMFCWILSIYISQYNDASQIKKGKQFMSKTEFNRRKETKAQGS